MNGLRPTRPSRIALSCLLGLATACADDEGGDAADTEDTSADTTAADPDSTSAEPPGDSTTSDGPTSSGDTASDPDGTTGEGTTGESTTGPSTTSEGTSGDGSTGDPEATSTGLIGATDESESDGGESTGGAAFDCPDWGDVVEVLPETTDSTWAPRVAMDPDGNAFVGYVSDNQVFVHRYDAATETWGEATALGFGGAGHGFAIATDAAGGAIAVWFFSNSLATRLYDGDTGEWAPQFNTLLGGSDEELLEVAMSGPGDAVIGFVSDSVLANVAYYDLAAGWQTPEIVGEIEQAVKSEGPARVDLAIDDSGAAFATWSHFDADGGTVRPAVVQHAADADPWGPLAQISASRSFTGDPRVVTLPDGDALSVWAQLDDGEATTVMTSHYDGVDSTWSAATLIGAADGEVYAPQLDADAEGNAIAVWTGAQVGANRFVGELGSWSGPVPLADSGSTGLAVDPASGDAVAVWSSITTGYRCYDASADEWSSAAEITAEFLGSFRIAAGAGAATIAWQTFEFDPGKGADVSTIAVRRLEW